ncbi:MAG: YfhO family protein [Clostridia bacterium]|nr:YfhO family protein [Clostridia bacterium]
MHTQTTFCNVKCPHCDRTLRAVTIPGVHLCNGCAGRFTLRIRKKAELAPESNKKQALSAGAVFRKIGKACWRFLKKNWAYFLAPFLVGLLYLFALWQGDVFPFGKYTAASYDLSAQICPFIEHLFDVMRGKSTLTYTYALGGGMDVVGTFLYFFVSPFSFIFLLFRDGRVAHACSIVMLLKLMAIAFAGTWFAKKLFKEIPDYLCVAVGVVYTYCGYTFVANTYINWLDFLIYLPFCAGAFKHFVKTDNFWPFALLMSACIYTCFSIACFSMFVVFPTLILYGVLCVEKGKKNKFIAYLCLSFVVAVLTALPVLLPALASYMRSGRGGGLFDNFWFGYSFSSQTGEIIGFDSSFYISSVELAFYRKLSYIIADSVFLALTLIWFCRKGLKDRFAKFMLIAGIFTMVPVLVDEATLLMNMGSYMSYALRFGFLNALYFLGGACLCLENICFKRACTYDGAPLWGRVEKEDAVFDKNERKTQNKLPMSALKVKKSAPISKKTYVVWLVICVVVGALATAFLIYYVNNYRSFLLLFAKDKESTANALKGFASSYAHSLGGLDVIVPLFIVALAVVGLGCILIYKKRISPRLLSFILIAVVGTQVMFYNDALVFGNRSAQHIELADYQALCQELDEREDGYFRVKDYGDEMTACAPLTGNTNAFSVFSSMLDADNLPTYQLFAYKGNGKNSFKSSHNTSKGNRAEEFGDSFLGYKYVMVPKSKVNEVDKKSYLKKVMTTDAEGNEVQLSNGSFFVYENQYVFPMGYTLKSGDFAFVSPNEANATYRKQNQAALYEFLRGENLMEFRKNTLVTASDTAELSEYLWSRAADVEVGAGKITAKVTAEEGEFLFLNFVASKGYSVTVNGKKAELVENDIKFLSVALETGENEVVFTYSSPYVKYVWIGAGATVVALCAVAFVTKKTKLMDKCAPVIAWTGIGLAVAVVAVFMVYPTGAFAAKLVEILKLAIA